MSGLLLFAWIMVLAVIIATIVIFFKNRKEKNEFDDFSWESEKRKEKKLFDRTNDEARYQVRDSNYEEQQYSNSDVENKLNDDKKYKNNDFNHEDENNLHNQNNEINNPSNNWENRNNTYVTKEKLKYQIKKNQYDQPKKIKENDWMIKPKRKKSPWWVVFGIIVALFRFCNSIDNANRKSYTSNQEIASQSITSLYGEWMEKAEEYENNGDYEKAEEYYQKAAEYNKEIYAVIGTMYYDSGDKEKGIEKLKEAYEKGAYSAAGMLGRAEEEKGDIDKAKEWYAKGIEKQDIFSQLSMAFLYKKEKKWDEAEKLILKGAEKDDKSSIYQLILLYFETNKETEMQKWKEKLFDMPQIGNLSVNERDMVLYATGNENDRKYVKLLLEAGYLKDEGKYKEAEKLYNEAIKYNKRAYNDLGNLYYLYYKNEDKAMEIYKKGHAEGSSHATYSLAILENNKGNKKEAEKLLKMCAEKGNLECQESYGEILTENNQKEEGLEWFKKAAEQKDSISMFKAMYYYYEKNDEVEVKKWARKILNEKGILNLNYKIQNYAEEIMKS